MTKTLSCRRLIRLLLCLSLAPSASAQPVLPGSQPGDTGYVDFTYRGVTTRLTTVRARDGHIWLQQNLGSLKVADSLRDTAAYGDYFQWGRWDDGHQIYQSAIGFTHTLPANDPSGLGGGSPYFYRSGGVPPADGWWTPAAIDQTWSNGPPSPSNGTDPCAALGSGWHIPDSSDWERVIQAEGITTPASAFASHLKLTTAGSRTTFGNYIQRGSFGYYWSNRLRAASPSDARYMYIQNTSANNTVAGPRSYGHSVRCVRGCIYQELSAVEICAGDSFFFAGSYRTEPGVYADSLQTSGGCDSIIILQLTVHPVPLPVLLEATLCAGDSFRLGDRYYYTTGSYRDTFTGVNNCDSIIELELQVVPELPHGSVSASLCRGESYRFGQSFLDREGSYTDTFRSAAGCDSVVTLHLTVHGRPHIRLSHEVSGRLCIGDSIRVTATGATLYTWQISPGPALAPGSADEIILSLSAPGSVVRVTGSGQEGCSDTAELEIDAEDCCMLQLPDAFTPNGDGRNDRFMPLGRVHPQQYRLTIRNRWGATVFFSSDPSAYWDGSLKGAPAEPGVYFYEISASCYDGRMIRRKGDVTLIR